MMITTPGSQPMTSHLSWRSTSEIWGAQVADAEAPGGVGEAVELDPPGRHVVGALTR